MSKALIVFGSTTGNTESVSETIAEILGDKGIDVTTKNVAVTKVEELGNGYDVTLLGSSTWGEDEIEFQEDFADFYEDMDKAKLEGKKVAIFGCGDSSYEHFCGAVDLLEEKVEDLKANLVNEPLRIDEDPEDSEDEISEWAAEVAAAV